jgi:hypothetical protein
VKKLLMVLMALPFMAHGETELSGGAGVEQRYFLQDPLYPQQGKSQLSLYLQPELYAQWNDGRDSLLFTPFVRLDQQDDERTHFDIRELVLLQVGEDWEIRTGIAKVFWGQTESLHLVDVINQTDEVEAPDGEDKLGQPMINLSLLRDWGTVSLFALPYFRERTFAGIEGRLRMGLEIVTDGAAYESKDEQHNLDWAMRWQQSVGDWELGLSYFDGTAREPQMQPFIDVDGQMKLQPFYPQMQQVGADILAVMGAWLVKFEGIHRETSFATFNALVGGFEYTTVGVLDSVYDLGWLVEYQYDERDEMAPSGGQNDVMAGSRIVFNDMAGTEILLAVIQDFDHFSSRSAYVEASSRLNDNWKWRVDGWFFTSDEPDDMMYMLRRDDFLQFSLEYYF